MAQRKPLVLNSGEIQQLQAGDSIQQEEDLNLTADAVLIAGNVVYASAADHVTLAKADAAGTSKVLGMTNAAIASGAVGPVQTGGVITLTTTQWDAAFGTTGGLTFNTKYYLSDATAGLGTVTAPSTVGHYVVELGVAISTTEFQLAPKMRILL